MDGDSSAEPGEGIPLRSIHQRVHGGSRQALQPLASSMNRQTSRSLLASSTRKKTGSRGKLRDSDEETTQATTLQNGGASAALTGAEEQDGEYDAGWKDGEQEHEHGLEGEEEQALLLEEGRVLVIILCKSIVYA